MGPLLAELQDARRVELVAMAPGSLEALASALVRAANAGERQPVIWPIGAAAERIAGAAMLIGAGSLEVWSGHERLDGREVLLVGVAHVASSAFCLAASHAGALGAAGISACGYMVARSALESIPCPFSDLEPHLAARRTA